MLEIDFGLSPLWLLVIVPVAGALTWWMYRNVNVEIPPKLVYVLRGIRFLVLFLVFALLLEPILTAVTEQKYKPIITLIVDDSESMAAHRDSSFMHKELKGKLTALTDALKAAELDVHIYKFSSELNRISHFDSIRYKQAGSNPGLALESIAERYANQNLAGVVLLSDGIATEGKNPLNLVQNFKVPFYTVLAGDTTVPKDLLVESAAYNDISYLNTITPIEVNLRASGVAAQGYTVKLNYKGKTLKSQSVTLGGGISSAKVLFEVKLESTGIQQYDVYIDQVPSEINYTNNHLPIFIKVLESRLKIAVFAGAPHPDLGALRKALTQNDRYTVIDYIRKNESEFYNNPQPADIKDADLFIFHNFPSSVNDKPIVEKIYAEIESSRKPIIQFIGVGTKMNIHPKQADYLALVEERPSQSFSESFLYIDPSYKSHSTYRFSDDGQFNKWIETAPPLLRNDGDWKAKQGANVFGKAKIKGLALNYPIFALQEYDGRKSMTFIGENFWRYRVHAYTEFESFALFDDWMHNIVQWLSSRSDKRKFRVYPTKNFYNSEERVVFKGQAYDDNYLPVPGAEIKLTLTDPEGKKLDYFLEETQAGSYQLELSNLEQGTYSYVAKGSRTGANLGEDKGEFSIGKSAIEFVQLRADEGLMRQLALRTNGSFTYARNIDNLSDVISKASNLKPMIDLQKSTRSLNRFILPLLILLLLLSIEWVLRKRYGLI